MLSSLDVFQKQHNNSKHGWSLDFIQQELKTKATLTNRRQLNHAGPERHQGHLGNYLFIKPPRRRSPFMARLIRASRLKSVTVPPHELLRLVYLNMG